MSRILPGLVSVTFRKLSPAEIVRLVRDAGLNGIEWGGDIHVPHGDVTRASEVRALTEDAGLTTFAYGSYYGIGQSEQKGDTFASVLDTAVALGAPIIRVWAGNQDSADADDAYMDSIAEESRRIAEEAAMAGIKVAFEYHGGTVADTAASVIRLLTTANHPSLRTLWQPSVGVSPDERLASLQTLLPHLSHIHVFHWNVHDPRPLSEGAAEWARYTNALQGLGRDVPMLLEFVQGDSPEAFLRDAQTLRGWAEAL